MRNMQFNTNKEKGRAGMALAIAYFGANGYTVNIPLNDTQWYDFVAEKDGVFFTVQCKATGSKDGRIDFRSTGGTNGGVYLFCVNQNMELFNIPIKDIPKNTKGITLRTQETCNKQGFQTYKYLVQI